MSSVFFLLIAIISSAAMTVVLKIFREQKGNRYGILLGNYLTCVLLSFLMMPDKSIAFKADGTTLLCGLIGGVVFVAGLVGMQSSTRRNGAILTSAFSKLGLIVPLLISVLFFGEKIRMLQIPGIVMVLVAFFLISFDSDSEDAKTGEKTRIYPILLLLVLLFVGGGDAMAKIFDQLGERSQDGNYFLILFVTAAVLVLILLFIEKGRSGKPFLWKEFAAGVLVGIPNYFSSALLLKALNGLPAFLVYPCFSAGTVFIVTLIATLFFKERPGVKTWIGLALIAVALVLLNI